MNKIVNATRKSFSFAWSKFAENEVTRKWYKDSLTYVNYIPKEIFQGRHKVGLDVGCGSGIDMINISKYGARLFGIDLSDTINVAYKNVADFKNIHVAQADIYNLPFRDETFDFAYSFGVLHHLPYPQKGFRIVCSKVKKRGYIIIYLYEDFSSRSNIEKILLKIANSPRIITKKMPPYLLYLFSIIAAPFIILTCNIPYRILNKLTATKNIAERIPYRHTCNPNIIVSDLYDRFSPPIENRYSRDEVEAWFNDANIEDVNIINFRGWVAWGRKK